MNQHVPFEANPYIHDDNLSMGLQDRPDPRPIEFHRETVGRVARLYRAAKQAQAAVPSPYQPAGEWVNYLAEREGLYNALREDDIDQGVGMLGNFWRNELGPIVKEYANYEQLIERQPEFVERFQQNVVRNYLIYQEMFRQPGDVLRIANVGNPWGYMIHGTMVAPKATRYHALTCQAANLTCDVEHAIIAEIGGGYGGFANFLLRDKGNCTYVDFDLPETLAIAAYYLLASHADRNIFLFGEGEIPRGDETRKYAAVLLPNYCLPAMPDGWADLLINTFSLSELTRETNKEYIQQIQRVIRGYFLHNNMDRKGVVNRGCERIPTSEYPIDRGKMKLIYRKFDLFHGHRGDYREELYQRFI